MIYISGPNPDNQMVFDRLVPVRFREVGYGPGIILGAFCDTRILGLLLAQPASDDPGSYVVLLSSQPAFEGLGVEKELLSAVEQEARRRGINRLVVRLRLKHGINAVEPWAKVYSELGWRLAPRFTQFMVHDFAITREHWFVRQPPEGYDLFLWRELSDAARRDLEARRLELTEQDPLFQDPFIETPDSHTSVGLLEKSTGRVMGWMVNQKYKEDLVCFRRLYVVPETRKTRAFYPLLSESIWLAFQSYVRATFSVSTGNTRMQKVLLRMMGHLCDEILDCYNASKQLDEQG